MIIISWDAGIINLAYCVMEYTFDPVTKEKNVKILDWDNLNLTDGETNKMECCGKIKGKKLNDPPRVCGKNATYVLKLDDQNIHPYCKTHLSQHTEIWTTEQTQALFHPSPKGECSYLKKTGDVCGLKSKFCFKHHNEKRHFCNTHYKSFLNKKIKELSPQPIKKIMSNNFSTAHLQLNLFNKLDTLIKKFADLGMEEVIIENQPVKKNPRMKSIANALFDYFVIRGVIDKKEGLNLNLVRFICPSNKLKVNNDNTIEVLKSAKSDTKYKLTKALGIQYTKQLLKDDKKNLEYLETFKKKDDVCDAYLQGRYYLEFVRNKDDLPPPSKKPIKKSTINSKKMKLGSKIIIDDEIDIPVFSEKKSKNIKKKVKKNIANNVIEKKCNKNIVKNNVIKKKGKKNIVKNNIIKNNTKKSPIDKHKKIINL